jgi:hypothetical protein
MAPWVTKSATIGSVQHKIVYLIHEVLREERHRGRSALIWLSDSLELLILNI